MKKRSGDNHWNFAIRSVSHSKKFEPKFARENMLCREVVTNAWVRGQPESIYTISNICDKSTTKTHELDMQPGYRIQRTIVIVSREKRSLTI